MRTGLLRRVPASGEKARSSLEKAERLLRQAQEELADERFEAAILVGYVALFNAERALLFRDGYREKSHACVTRYLEHAHGQALGQRTIALLDEFREARHSLQYDVDYLPAERDAREIVAFAREFLHRVRPLLKTTSGA